MAAVSASRMVNTSISVSNEKPNVPWPAPNFFRCEDRRMSKAHLKVHMGGLETAIDFYQTAPTPNLIILESRREPRDLIESLAQLAEVCDPTTKVVVIGHYNDVWLYRELVKSGIS